MFCMFLLLKFIVLGLVVNNTIVYGMVKQTPNDLLCVIAFQGDGIVKNKLRQVNKHCAKQFCMGNNYFVMNLNLNFIANKDKEAILFKALWAQNKGKNKQKKIKQKKIKQAIIDRYKSLYNNGKDVLKIENFFSAFDSDDLNNTFFKNEITFEKIEKTEKYIRDLDGGIQMLLDGRITLDKNFLTSRRNSSAKDVQSIMEVLPFTLLYDTNGRLTKYFFEIMSVYCKEWSNEQKRISSFSFMLRASMVLNRENIFTILVKKDPFETKNICTINKYERLYQELEKKTTVNDENKKRKYLDILSTELRKESIDIDDNSECILC